MQETWVRSLGQEDSSGEVNGNPLQYSGFSQVAQVAKNPPDNAGDVRDMGSSPGWEDSLEKEMTTHSSITAWRLPWREEPGGLQSMGSHRVGHDVHIHCLLRATWMLLSQGQSELVLVISWSYRAQQEEIRKTRTP